LGGSLTARLSGLPGEDALILAQARKSRPTSARIMKRATSAMAGRAMAWIRRRQGKSKSDRVTEQAAQGVESVDINTKAADGAGVNSGFVLR